MATHSSSSGEQRQRLWLGFALIVSLLFHASLLLVQRGEQSTARERQDLVIALDRSYPANPIPEPAPPIDAPEPDPAPPEPEREPDETVADVAGDEPTPPEVTTPQAVVSLEEQNDDAEAPITAAQFLSDVRESLDHFVMPDEHDALQPQDVPDLPGAPGWINQYVGTVESSTDFWDSADGSTQARVVTASGQVFCGKARAPTPSDVFNPQFAVNIMLWRDCGRVRPDPPDPEDPWQRTPGS